MSRPALFCNLFLVACSAAKTQNLPDGGSTDAGPRCGIPAAPTCATTALLNQTFQIDPDGTHEISSSIAFDGTLWVAYTHGDTTGETHNLQVWLTRFGCDGTVLLPPVKVNTDGANSIEPVIAVSDGVVLVAWLADSQAGGNNMTIRYRLYGASDAAALSVTEMKLRTTRDGQPVDANMGAPAIAPLPGSGFVIAAVRSSADETRFQAFAQRTDAAGGLVGPTIDGNQEEAVSHSHAAVTAGPDGSLYLAWEREARVEGTSLPLMHTIVEPDATTAQPAVEAYHQTAGSYPEMSSGLASCSRPYLTFEAPLAGSKEVMIADAANLSVTAPVQEIYIPQEFAVGPQIAASDDGGAVAWLAETSSPTLYVHVQRFTHDGTNWQLGKRVNIAPMVKFSIRPPSITHISGNTYVVTWVEGSGATTYTYARLVSLDD